MQSLYILSNLRNISFIITCLLLFFLLLLAVTVIECKGKAWTEAIIIRLYSYNMQSYKIIIITTFL